MKPLSMLRVPLAWRMLIHKKKRLALSLAAVTFAVLIMFMQLGFFNGFNDSQALLLTKFDGDLVLMDVRRAHLGRWTDMPRTRLAQAAALPEVVQAIPIQNAGFNVKNAETGQYRRVYALAFPPDANPFAMAELPADVQAFRRRGTVLFDRQSRDIYGPLEPGKKIEVNGQLLELAGFFSLGANFTNDGTLLMSEPTYFDLVGGDNGLIAWAVLRLRPGTDVEAFRRKLAATLPVGITILTPEEMREREVSYMIRKAPVGIVFGIGLAIGFGIGVILCYQILFNEITDHLSQFATLKAMGFSAGFLKGVVLQEAVLLALVGFVPGVAGGYLLYWVLEQMTGIVMFQTVGRAIAILVLTVLMCVVAGWVAVRRVLQMDPADVF